MFGHAYFGSSYYGAQYWGPTAGAAPPVDVSEIVWPAALPQVFLATGYGQSMADNLIVDNYEVGPPSYRRRTTANVFGVEGEMAMTTEEWDDLDDFIREETLSRSLPFSFPKQGTDAVEYWLVLMDKPPSRSYLSLDFWLVSISLLVLPQ